MSRVPMFSNRQGVKDNERLTDAYELIHQGLSAERIADRWDISKETLDLYAVESHRRAIQAVKEGRFDKEIHPITTADGEVCSRDEGPRTDTSMEALAQLKPPFKEGGKITAGNASQISDGAAALLLMSKEKAEAEGIKGRCRIASRSVIGSDPTLMLTGPLPATYKALEKAGLALEDIDLFEVNEAFASVPLFWMKETGYRMRR